MPNKIMVDHKTKEYLKEIGIGNYSWLIFMGYILKYPEICTKFLSVSDIINTNKLFPDNRIDLRDCCIDDVKNMKSSK